MYKWESFLENEIHKILWGFEIQTNHQILAWRQDLVTTEKKKRKEKENLRIVDSTVPADHRVKTKES